MDQQLNLSTEQVPIPENQKKQTEPKPPKQGSYVYKCIFIFLFLLLVPILSYMTINSSKQNNTGQITQQQLIYSSSLSQAACSSKGVNETTTMYPAVPDQYNGSIYDKIFSSDGWHSVFKVATTSAETVYKSADGTTISSSGIIQTYIIDGVKQKDYVSVDQFMFSPNNCHYAYIAQNTHSIKYFVVIDGKESPGYDSVSSLTFSPDSSDFAYVADRDHKEYLVLNGKELEGYSKIANITFSPNSEGIAYYAALKKSQKFVVSGAGTMIRDTPGKIINISYITTKRNQRVFAIDNTVRNVPHGVVTIKFSTDSKHFVYTTLEQVTRTINAQNSKVPAFNVNQLCIYLDNAKKGCGDEDGSIWTFTRSGDLSYYLSAGLHKGGELSIHNKKTKITLPIYEYDSPQFTPDGENYYYVTVAYDFKNCQSIRAIDLIVNGNTAGAYEYIGSIKPSPDSKRLIFSAQQYNKDCSIGKSGTYFINLDGLTEETTNILSINNRIGFSSDSKVFVADDYRGKIIFGNNQFSLNKNENFPENSVYNFDQTEGTSPVIISPNDQKFAYVVRQDILNAVTNLTNASYFVFVNSNNAKFDSYDQIFMKPIFSKDSSKIMYPAQKGNSFYWVVSDVL